MTSKDVEFLSEIYERKARSSQVKTTGRNRVADSGKDAAEEAMEMSR